MIVSERRAAGQIHRRHSTAVSCSSGPTLGASTTNTATLYAGFALQGSGNSVFLFNRPTNGGGLLDAIYFGLERWNARERAANFKLDELPSIMAELHRRGVKGYVTFNTLVFANEMAEAEQYLRAIITAGVDAAIVQDVGICRLIRRLSPDFPIHASTQMTITSAGGVEFARELGCHLVVLARECSLKEIEKIQNSQGRAACPHADGVGGALGTTRPTPPLPLEVFVHGALCVAYSGQCLTSEALGGRSANRGECAQACRMPYELISDGKTVPLGDKRYLLSPQDLAGLPVCAVSVSRFGFKITHPEDLEMAEALLKARVSVD